jgi:hypothetical protein
MKMFVYCQSQPIIESSSRIDFTRLNIVYKQYSEQMEANGWIIALNNVRNIYDFTPGISHYILTISSRWRSSSRNEARYPASKNKVLQGTAREPTKDISSRYDVAELELYNLNSISKFSRFRQWLR